MTEKTEIIKHEHRMIQSIQRASKILDLFIGEKNPLGISDFAQKLNLPKTTIQGIVTTLMELRLLEKDRHSAKYRLGTKLFQLGMSYATNMDIMTLARVWMERLCFKYREAVNVGMLVGSQVLIIFRVEPDKRFMTFPQSGSLIPAHTSSIGKILFSHMRKDKRDEILADYSFDCLTQNSIGNIDRYKQELETVRNNGIAFDNEENIIGLAGIGAPIFNFTGQVIAAFAISGDAVHIGQCREEIIAEVKNTSREVSRQLGYQE
ncbi:MAG: hypothetical protein CVV44_02130 [Spirochaetae bacterium HGW-Spirochaetae-1]|jgi:DNA-binding IclR family transcriptional regulator|nr:MAG: hypothetical protein CVV44_02130 [Spirochaetae bacterium HGW-Spirochaetae-1]